MERQVLVDEDLSWAAFHRAVRAVDLGRPAEPGNLAEEAGVTKGTLDRRAEDPGEARPGQAGGRNDGDGRLVLVSLEPKGLAVIERLFPRRSTRARPGSAAALTEDEKIQLASLLRKIIRSAEPA